MALIPGKDLGVVLLWNSESALPGGLLPTILDNALGLTDGKWLNDEIDASSDMLYADGPHGAGASSAEASPPPP